MSLTQKDFDEIEQVVEKVVNKKTSNLPTKDEFFGSMDKLVTEIKASREEQTILSHRVSDHEDRIEKIENKLQIPSN
ncbi:MAG: hypothetical protein UV74_C0002G0053 [Candidatus Woesebacteria bacterium GW2011_GWB1_43_14]|uniref:Uncharacterized protein n=1 Tax=Candidatus Woesebacteria bacterium GW2011_GWB1_43_14 TaxID=1618578 RepID=A0A0G1GJ85_9BACT|nr:MAG: hypothetical protein UV51_C0004G0002 [Candidatus Woesebacteria bacterium GW2011_GWC1_42_9]KKS98833.1 MAG: hypothetical protein UV74_C0002G0053 [Candidatus Woesebacteria bacterium GW2011_GWB1_43_14]